LEFENGKVEMDTATFLVPCAWSRKNKLFPFPSHGLAFNSIRFYFGGRNCALANKKRKWKETQEIDIVSNHASHYIYLPPSPRGKNEIAVVGGNGPRGRGVCFLFKKMGHTVIRWLRNALGAAYLQPMVFIAGLTDFSRRTFLMPS